MNFQTIDAKTDTVQGFALVRSCDKKTSKNGSFYLDIVLSDRDGDISAKVWDYKGTDDMMPVVNSVIRVRGQISVYNNAPQLRIDRYRQSVPDDGIDMNEFVPSASFDGAYMYGEILKIVDSFRDTKLQKLCTVILDSVKEKLLFWPAAYKLHHAIRGGLLMHTLSIVRMADMIAKQYPSVDRDLLLCGAILHDIAKLDEFNVAETGLVESYTVRGTLVGHLVGGAMLVEQVGKDIGIDDNTLMLVEHMLISHHGEPEYGAAIRPLFLEAEILASLDVLDANIFEINSALSSIGRGEFTSRMWSMQDRKFFNHGRKVITTDVKI